MSGARETVSGGETGVFGNQIAPKCTIIENNFLFENVFNRYFPPNWEIQKRLLTDK